MMSTNAVLVMHRNLPELARIDDAHTEGKDPT